jgi:hypothetical protein
MAAAGQHAAQAALGALQRGGGRCGNAFSARQRRGGHLVEAVDADDFLDEISLAIDIAAP